jgi:hypothetical protein
LGPVGNIILPEVWRMHESKVVFKLSVSLASGKEVKYERECLEGIQLKKVRSYLEGIQLVEKYHV